MRIIYLALAVWGAVHPMYYFVSWFQTEGLNLGLMVAAWHEMRPAVAWFGILLSRPLLLQFGSSMRCSKPGSMGI